MVVRSARHGRARWFAAGVAATAVMGGVAYASTDPGASTIRGCVSSRSGALRILGDGATCAKGETLLTWNAAGRDGAPGLVWRGEWSATTAYAGGDAVAKGGSSFIALAASTGQDPSAGGPWQLLAGRGLDGPAGPTGPAGAAGAPGAPGAPGQPGLVWRGAWAEGSAYGPGDAVAHDGSSFVALTKTDAEPGTDPEAWELLAGRGAAGPAGEPGAPGAPGPAGGSLDALDGTSCNDAHPDLAGTVDVLFDDSVDNVGDHHVTIRCVPIKKPLQVQATRGERLVYDSQGNTIGSRRGEGLVRIGDTGRTVVAGQPLLTTWFPAGEVVVLRAEPAQGHQLRWTSGPCANTVSSTCTVTVDRATSAAVRFDPPV